MADDSSNLKIIKVDKTPSISSLNDIRPSTKKLIKDYFLEWSLSSTSHGFPSIFRAKLIIIKIMWIICVLVSAAFCCFMVVKSFTEFFEYEVITKIRVYQERPIIFPAITICNLNPFPTKEGNDYILEYFNQKYNESFSSYSDILKKIPENDISGNFEMIIQQTAGSEFSEERKKKFGYSAEYMFIKCYFNNAECQNSDFEWVYYANMGNCFKFNSFFSDNNLLDVKKLLEVGYKYGLKLEVFVGLKNYSIFSYKESSGLKVIVHNQTIFPSDDEGIEVQVGKCTNIQIQKVFTNNQYKPYSNCDDLSLFKSNLYDFIKNSKYAYRYQDCLDLCYQMNVIEKCGCYDVECVKYKDVKPCYLDLNDYICLVKVYNQFLKNENNEICNKECPIECDSVEYNLETSFSDYPSESYAQNLKNNTKLIKLFSPNEVTENDLQESMVCLNIYFENFFNTLISEKEKLSTVDLVANVGGTLGLFIGVSLLSFVEVAELVLEIIIIALKNRKTNKKTSPI